MFSQQKTKIIFFGTPEFAAIILEKLINFIQTHHQFPFFIQTVVTTTDKPVGRKQILIPSPVKLLAEKYQIQVLQPKDIRNLELEIRNLRPDLIILAAYGQIIPPEILKMPKFGCLNIHPSLLPKYRGASPIQATILNGEKETGVTIILMDEKIDHGPILAQKKLKISDKVNYLELCKVLANLGAELLVETLPKMIKRRIKAIPQNHQQATFTKVIRRENGKINWTTTAEKNERMVRAYWPWPSAYTYFIGKRLKIIEAEVFRINHQKKPGMVFLIENKRIAVACAQDALILEKVQLEGKKPIDVKDFLNGYPGIIGVILN